MIRKEIVVFMSAMLLKMIAGQAIPAAYPANIGNAIAANALAANANIGNAIAANVNLGNAIAANANLANGIAANGIAANVNAANAAETAAIANGMAYASPGYATGMMPNPYAYPYGPSPYPYEVEIPVLPVPGPGLTYGLSLSDLAASHGNGLRVISSSSLSPSGVTVQSDNMAVEGPLSVSGQMPFLGVVAVEGPLPAIGQGAVGYGSGNGNIGMVSEGVNEVAYPNQLANVAYKNGIVGPIANPALGPNPLSYNAMPSAV